MIKGPSEAPQLHGHFDQFPANRMPLRIETQDVVEGAIDGSPIVGRAIDQPSQPGQRIDVLGPKLHVSSEVVDGLIQIALLFGGVGSIEKSRCIPIDLEIVNEMHAETENGR